MFAYPNYSQAYNQYPYMQPVIQQNNINGKTIQRIEDITANDVPMDGSNAIFPYFDSSKIIVKHWNSNGTISTVEYLPQIDVLNNKANNSMPNNEKDVYEPIMSKLDSIQEQINKLIPEVKENCNE